MTAMQSESLYTPADVAVKLHVNKSTVYKLIRDNRLPAVRIGRSYRVLPQDLRVFLEIHSTRPQVRTARYARVAQIARRNESASEDAVLEQLEQLDRVRKSTISS